MACTQNCIRVGGESFGKSTWPFSPDEPTPLHTHKLKSEESSVAQVDLYPRRDRPLVNSMSADTLDATTEDGEPGPAEYFSVKVVGFDLCRSSDGR